jgi:hypothetical protein
MAQRAVAGPGGERNLHVTTVRPGHHDTPARRHGRTARLRTPGDLTEAAGIPHAATRALLTG